MNFVRYQNDGVVPEIYESSSEGSTSGDTWTEGSSEAFANPHYAYNNEGFTTEKDSLPVRYIDYNKDGRHSPLYATKM